MSKLETTNNIEINTQFQNALDLMNETDKSVFITGKAGTGKSTLLSHFCKNTNKKLVVLAPTGVAALNVKGQTIHSFFNFYIDVTPEKIRNKETTPKDSELYKKLKTIIIDEVSMVRADLLDCVDVFLRMYGPNLKKPFGGVQMIFIGDLYQLPPIVIGKEKEIFSTYYKTPYFFSAHAFKGFDIELLELEKVYRQKDQIFVELLNKIRNNSVDEEDLNHLDSRFKELPEKEHSFYINLTTTNKKADEINDEHLQKLSNKLHHYVAEIKGDISNEYFPTAVELQFKVGAQIMLLNNEQKRLWVNGSIGVIEAIKKDIEGETFLSVRLQENNKIVNVYKYTWEVYKFSIENKVIVSKPVGTFKQYPFRLAWAITIHKSQGKTFNHVIIDIDKGTFVTGQMYVALSRCTSFEGIILKKPLKKHHIRTDYRIFDFLTSYQYRKSEEMLSKEDKIALIKQAILDEGKLEITYLKANDTKSVRTVIPINVGTEKYRDKSFTGMSAFCETRCEERMFRVDRILEIRKINSLNLK